MGTHGTYGLQKVFGSRALKVITNSRVPFVIVQKKTNESLHEGFKEIVLPLNLTMETKQKLGWAVHVAKRYGSTIHLIATKETDEFLANKINANLHFSKKNLTENRVPYTIRFVEKGEKTFYDLTIDYAHEMKANLIIAMTTKSKDIADYVIGPFEEKIINNQYQIPVMCVNPRDIATVF
jgi:nucleotide-binding universal stress UspA family protein